MAYAIRQYREGDAGALAEITGAAIHAIGPRAYSRAQVMAWAARHPGAERFVSSATKGALIFIAVDDNDRPVAYALLEPDGHLDMLYCHPDHTRRGLAGQLLAEADLNARRQGISKLYTEASELARPAFQRAGYRVSHRRDFTIEYAGGSVPIHNYAMTKTLD
ncbi:Acetyltransferase, GNAT family [Altererythrobacter xiamenensis]|uniref:Acetyltransferase, GNAT family n=1 Tax=Altererythrobacter xiamenensis TaxID=1316679 RepID=A0A1Y6FIA0_9SPHN|nr:GNAT family N-acetyltransferase [Altererythrobacter xiamenensis]SMQ74417.1 Acetyltransferase, GNAT family [Altererythrobacter xiamenensis]